MGVHSRHYLACIGKSVKQLGDPFSVCFSEFVSAISLKYPLARVTLHRSQKYGMHCQPTAPLPTTQVRLQARNINMNTEILAFHLVA